MKKQLREMVVQRFPYRCPYCDQPLSYESYSLKVGENEIVCPFCKKKFIKVIFKEISLKKIKRIAPKRKNNPQ